MGPLEGVKASAGGRCHVSEGIVAWLFRPLADVGFGESMGKQVGELLGMLKIGAVRKSS